jgi:hypothetical protein
MAISTVDLLLTPADPGRALRHIVSEVERLAALDPKLHQARTRIMDSLATAVPPSDEQETLGAVVWLHLRGRLASRPAAALETVRLWLGDGDLVLRTVEDALRTTLTAQVLRDVVHGAGHDADATSGRAHLLDQARAEVRRAQGEVPEDSPVVVAALLAAAAGAVVGATIAEIIHAHRE